MTIAPKKSRRPTKETPEQPSAPVAPLRPSDRVQDFIGLPRGRPRKPENARTIYPLKIAMDAKTLSQIDQVCEETGETPAAMARRAICEWIAMRRKDQINALPGAAFDHMRNLVQDLLPDIVELIAQQAAPQTPIAQQAEPETLKKLVDAASDETRAMLLQHIKQRD